MLCFTVLTLAVLHAVIFASPVPQELNYGLSGDVLSNNANPDCTQKLSINQPFDSNDIDDNQDLSIFRRRPQISCPATGFISPKYSPQKPKEPPDSSQPSNTPADRSTNTGNSDPNPCAGKDGKNEHVTCGGPEVREGGIIAMVANCINGKSCPGSSSIIC